MFETKSSYCHAKVKIDSVDLGRHGSSTMFETGLSSGTYSVLWRFNFTPCKRIQDCPGFWIPRRGFQIQVQIPVFFLMIYKSSSVYNWSFTDGVIDVHDC